MPNYNASLVPMDIDTPNYVFTVDMRNEEGGDPTDTNTGNYGILYNAVDANNFDFVYVSVRLVCYIHNAYSLNFEDDLVSLL